MSLLLLFTGASTVQTIAVTNANLHFSPYATFFSGSTYAQWNNEGNELKFRVTLPAASSVTLLLDNSPNSGIAADDYPTLAYGYDDRPFTNELLTSGQTTLTLASGLSSGTYTFKVRGKSIGASGLVAAADRWATPQFVTRITGIQIPASATMETLTTRANTAIFWGDSYTAGVNNSMGLNALEADDLKNAGNDAFRSWAHLVAEAFDCEYGMVAFSGQGFNTKGIGNGTVDSGNPSLYNTTDANQSYDKYHSGQAKDLTSPSPPDFIWIMIGAADSSISTSDVTTFLDELRTIVGSSTWIFWCGHSTSFPNRSNIMAGIAAVADTARTKYLDGLDFLPASLPAPSEWSDDAIFGGSHPNVKMGARMGAYHVKQAQDFVAAGAGSGSGRRRRLLMVS